MNQSHDELVRGLTYIRDTIAKMQGIFREYAQIKKELSEEKQAIGRSYILHHKWALTHDILWMVAFAGAVAIHDTFIFVVFAICLALAHWSWSLRGFLKKLIYLAAGIFAVTIIMLGWTENMLLMLVAIVVEFAVFLLNWKIRNWKIASDNRKIADRNQAIKAKMKKLADSFHQLEDEVIGRTSSWYPQDYYNMEAAEFFLNAVRNHRADSVKEMVNLFETTAEHRKLLEFQERQVKEQRRRQELLAQNQQAIQEQLRYADMMGSWARFFNQYADNAERSLRDMEMQNIKQSLHNIENNLNRR